MSDISTSLIKKAVKKLCFDANTCLNSDIYKKLSEAYFNENNQETKNILSAILKNAKIAYEKKLPLCQDTGQVLIFLEIGQDVKLTGEYIETAINDAVEESYRENYFRKSVVKNAIFERENTKTNTPVIIYTDIVAGDEINITLLVKGAGSENKSRLEMLLPTTDEEEFIIKAGDLILSAAENSCPPMFIGIGTGGSADGAMLLSKRALISDDFDGKEIKLAQKIKDYVNSKAPKKYGNSYVQDIKILSKPTHIACMPLGITINCHSDRYSKCTIKNDTILYEHKTPDFIDIEEVENHSREVLLQDISAIAKLKEGEEVLLTGELYVARDMAHKRLVDMIKKGIELPIEIKDNVILYAGPCPNKEGEIIGSIGPTTASRMDKYAVILYKNGLIASIGKGERSEEAKQIIRKIGGKYLSVQGGVAALLAQKVKTCDLIAFSELGAEAIYKIYVEKFPAKVEIA